MKPSHPEEGCKQCVPCHRAYIAIWHAGTGHSEGLAETREWPILASACFVETLAKTS